MTDVNTGLVTNVQPLDTYTAILNEFDAWCTDVTRNTAKHMRVTLWDTETNMSHGSREVNVPVVKVPTTEEIHKYIREQCAKELEIGKVTTIKKVREHFCKDGFMIGLKDTKDHVETVIAEDKAAKKNLPPCGSLLCDNMDCTF